MGIFDLIVFFGGVGLFLYGIKIMSRGLELIAGSKLKALLKKVTSNKIIGILVGLLITALIQSSSATTVMVVSLVNSGLINLYQATSVIIGANIGTTVTSVLIALNLSEIAPLFIFFGAVILVFTKNNHLMHIGEILSGFGLLFLGMNTMTNAMTPLQNSVLFADMMIKANNPAIAVLVGLLFTSIIQSSSASIGVLQALAFKRLISIEFAVFVLYGQNIGTCVTALLSAAGGKINSKRTAVIHLLFNLFGTILFIFITKFTPFVDLLKIISNDTVVQISAAHIIFNTISAAVLLPFSNTLVSLSCRIIPDKRKYKIGSKILKTI